MEHLTDRTYAELLAGTLPAEEARALGRHLREACEICEEFLAARPDDALDARVDRSLAAAGGTGEPGNDLEFQRIMLRAHPPMGTKVAAPRRRSSPLRSVAVAAAVVVAGVAGLVLTARRPAPPAWDGEKGATVRGVPVRLRFLVVSPGEGGPALEKGVSGQAVAAAASLQFEVELGRAADVALVRVPATGTPELVLHEALRAGRTAVSVDGRPAAYPLEGLAGPQRFVVLASPDGLDPARVTRAAAALAPPARASADAPALDGLSVDVVEVSVR